MVHEKKRKVDLVILSDVHLGTYGCHAKELFRYLRTIKPRTIILNGDFIDIWQFNKRYWPKSHMKVVKHLMGEVAKGTKVVYITGNHDELLRKFNGFAIGSFSIVNKLLLTLDNSEKAWIFHGDVFDVTMKYSKWLAMLGGRAYNLLIFVNRLIDFIAVDLLKKNKISISRKIKSGVKKAVAYIDDFEKLAAEAGINNGYQYVICGHIHQPQQRLIRNEKGSIVYLNSGDWIENLSALEYHKGSWSIHYHHEDHKELPSAAADEEMDTKLLFRKLVSEFADQKTA